MKPYEIKAFWTHVLYVTILIKHDMHAQLLTFTKMASAAKPVLYCLKETKALLER